MFRLEITVKTADEVLELRAKIAALQAEVVDITAKYNRVEYSFRCEVIINSELVDLCRASGVKFRPSILAARQSASEAAGEAAGSP